MRLAGVLRTGVLHLATPTATTVAAAGAPGAALSLALGRDGAEQDRLHVAVLGQTVEGFPEHSQLLWVVATRRGPTQAHHLVCGLELFRAVPDGVRRVAQPTRMLATVLFTDIVGSTRRAGELGDRRWREPLNVHDELTGRLVEEFGGQLVKTTGDGILGTFDGPGRAIHRAVALREELTGIGVHIAARIMAAAKPDEILVSRTVRTWLPHPGGPRHVPAQLPAGCVGLAGRVSALIPRWGRSQLPYDLDAFHTRRRNARCQPSDQHPPSWTPTTW
jgi:class 3 adenylate cyclase